VKHAWSRGEGWGKVTAGLVGGFALFLGFGLATGLVLPRLGVPMGRVLAFNLVVSIPVWALALGVANLAPSGRGAWLRVGGSAALAWGVVGAVLVFS
jgi:hypothetical protein